MATRIAAAGRSAHFIHPTSGALAVVGRVSWSTEPVVHLEEDVADTLGIRAGEVVAIEFPPNGAVSLGPAWPKAGLSTHLDRDLVAILPPALVNKLRTAGITKVRQLVVLTPASLLKTNGIGRAALVQIEKALATLDLSLGSAL